MLKTTGTVVLFEKVIAVTHITDLECEGVIWGELWRL